MEKTRIAVEATGGDKGYLEVARGVEMELERRSDLEIFLTAGKDELRKQGLLTERGELVEEAIPRGMDKEHIILTEHTFKYHDKNSWNGWRVSRSTSIAKAVDMHHAREVDAVIALGDTYPTVAYPFDFFDRIGKVRPAIAVDFFGNVLIDAGANSKSDCKPKNYYHFAIMGYVIAKYKLGIKDPVVGVVANGTEDWKGDSLAQAALSWLKGLKAKGYNIEDGFFEPTSLRNPQERGFRSGLVLVTNGFLGNVMLKMGEVSFELSGDLTRAAYQEEPWWSRWLGAIPLSRIKEKVKAKVDYRSFGAAPLFGYQGNIMVGHGRSDADAVFGAIERTCDYLTYNLNDRLKEELERLKA